MNDELLAKEMLRGLESELGGEGASADHKKRPSYGPLYDNLASGLLTIILFLLPFVAIPFASVPLDLAKRATLVIGVALAFLFWLGARLEDGVISVPKSPILAGAKLLALVALVSSFASGMFNASFWGIGTETGSTSSVFVFFVLMFLSAIYFQSRKRLVTATKAFLLSFVILAVIEIIRLFPTFQGITPLFGHGSTFFGMLPGSTDNLLGKWNDLGSFFALGVVACMSLLELLDTHLPRTLIYASGLVGMLLMFLVNFNVAWIVLAVMALLLIIYKLSIKKVLGPNFRFAMLWSMPATYVLIISLLCFFLYAPIGNYLSASQISSLEVRPAWGSTFEVVGKTLKNRALFGSGPNTFSTGWLMNKPAGVNDTVFWNTDFNAGVGYVPTFIATTGILGLLAWLLFLGSYLYFGARALFKLSGDHLTHGVLSVSFLMSLFLWIMAMVYVPDTVMLSLTFALTGIFIGSLVTTKFSSDYVLEFSNNPRFSFASVLGIVVLMLLSVVFLFVSAKKYVALANFQSALVASNTKGDLARAKKSLEAAVALDGADVFYRSLADLHVLEMSRILNTAGASQEQLQSQFKTALDAALTAGDKAVKANTANYQNHLSFGRVYEAMVPFKTPGAYERALAEYQAALSGNPHNPQIYLTMARLELAKGDKTKARENITKSLAEKSNYAAAIFLLSQIEADAGNLEAAIKNAEQAAIFAPQDIGVYFQLGFLKYLKHDYKGAINALATAVTINPSYANAKYFLGLSLDKIGKEDEALEQFEQIARDNPDNTEVPRIIANIKAGRDALANAPAPEKRSAPPVRQ